MVSVKVVNINGESVKEIEIEPTLLDSCIRKPLLKEAVIAYNASQRQGSASTKTRSEVQGGTKKPWNQKGTGRARAGSIRSPIFVGGGKAHGPKPRDFGYRLPKKQRFLAKQSSLRFRLEQNQIIAIEGLEELAEIKTKTIVSLISKLGLSTKGILLVSEEENKSVYLSSRNIQKLNTCKRADLCAGLILKRPNLLMSSVALDSLIKEASE